MCFCNLNIDWTAVWTSITAIATIGLVIVAYVQLNKFNITTASDFAHRFKNDFFVPETTEILMLLEYETLDFIKGEKLDIKEWGKPDYCPYYRINRELLRKINPDIKLINEERKIYTLFEIENFVLNHFEDLAILRDKKILTDDDICSGFGAYIEIVMKNKNIQEHIRFYRFDEDTQESDEDVYFGCDELYEMFLNMNRH